MTENRSAELATQSGITLFGNLFGKVLGFLFLIVVTRLVAPELFGTFTLALSIVMFVQGFGDLNLHRAIDYYVPQYLDNKELAQAGTIFRRVLITGTVSTTICALLVTAATPWVGSVFKDAQLTVILPAMTLVLPLLFYFRVGLAVFNSIKRMKYRVITRNFVRPVGKVLGTVGFVAVIGELWGLMLGYLLALVLAVAVAALLVFRAAPWIRKPGDHSAEHRELLRYSAPLMFAGVMYAVISQIDFLVIGYYHPSEQVAEYRVASQLASNLTIFLSSVAPVFKPMIAEINDDDQALNSQFQSAARWLALLTLPPAITMAISPRSYLQLLFTETYTGAGTAVTVLALGYVIHVAVGPEGMMIEGIDRTELTMVNTATFLTVNAVVDVLLVPRLGVLGAAIGTAAALATAVCLGVSELYLLRRIHPFSWSLAKVLAAGGCATLAGIVISTVVHSIVIVVILPIVVSVAFLLTVVGLEGFSQNDLAVARRLDERLGYSVFSPVIKRGHS